MNRQLINHKKAKFYGRRRGSALIITILLISVISTLAFSVSALTISEFRKAATIQDSISAFYAAESGIEQGLMEYRLWHDVEISKEIYSKLHSANQQVTSADSPTESEGSAQTFRLIGPGGVGIANSTANRGSSWYDLKMWYKGDHIGDLTAIGNPTIDPTNSNAQRIYRDSALQITANGASSFKLAWAPEGPNAIARATSPYRYFIETVMNAPKNLAPDNLARVLIDDSQLNDQPKSVNFPISNVETIRIKPWDMDAMRYSLTLLDSAGQRLKFDTQTSYIESNGVSGRAQRKLRVSINRTSGTVLEAEDFLFITGQKPLLIP